MMDIKRWRKIRNCVPFIDGRKGILETQLAIDEMIALIEDQQRRLSDISRAPHLELSCEEIDTLEHTAYRAPAARHCGETEEVRSLVLKGLMEFAFKTQWCPDPFFKLTMAGRAYLREREAAKHA